MFFKTIIYVEFCQTEEFHFISTRFFVMFENVAIVFCSSLFFIRKYEDFLKEY